jgi:guanine deaminase
MNNMDKACDLASYSITVGGGPFGCVITDKNDKIIATGHNMVTINNDPTQHAEVVAIRNACKELDTFNLTDCKIYTSCEPCPMCLGAIYWARIEKIYYSSTRSDAKGIGFDDDFIYEEIKKDNNNRKIKMEQIITDKYNKSFCEWIEYSNKTKY